jgi:hypothetical protein
VLRRNAAAGFHSLGAESAPEYEWEARMFGGCRDRRGGGESQVNRRREDGRMGGWEERIACATNGETADVLTSIERGRSKLAPSRCRALTGLSDVPAPLMRKRVGEFQAFD